MHERIKKIKKAKSIISEVTDKIDTSLIVHYSCESFYDRPNGASPRVTSIAVRNLGNAQTISFSIHQIAEEQSIEFNQIETHYDQLEKTMLARFYEYARPRCDRLWLHWNMRDINYGFQAIAHRFRVLKGDPIEIPENQMIDMARLLISMYGVRYISHPRLKKIMEKNKIADVDFLTGKEEAEAFNNKEYVKLHQSTLRKVDVIANLWGRLSDGTLKTNAKWGERYGSTFAYIVYLIQNNWVATVICFVSAILGIVSFFKG